MWLYRGFKSCDSRQGQAPYPGVCVSWFSKIGSMYYVWLELNQFKILSQIESSEITKYNQNKFNLKTNQGSGNLKVNKECKSTGKQKMGY